MNKILFLVFLLVLLQPVGSVIVTSSGTQSSGGITAGVQRFTGLLDTPNSYTSSLGYLVRVNANGDGLEFINGDSLASNGSLIDHGTLIGLGDDDHTQYHNNARALTWLGTRSTTDLAEGTNKYYTGARVNGDILDYSTSTGWSAEDNGGTLRSIQLSGDNGFTFNTTAISGNGGALRGTVDSSLFGTVTRVSNGDIYSTVSNQTTVPKISIVKSLIYNGSIFNGDFAQLSTSNLAEGTNLYYTSTRANGDALQVGTEQGWSAEDNGGTLGSINNGNALITIANGTGYYSTITPVATLSSYTNNLSWSPESNGGTMRSIQPSGDNGFSFSVSSISGNGGALRGTFDSSLYQPSNGNLTTWAGKSIPSGTVVGTTDSQTLTNKILTSPTLNNTIVMNGTTFSIPAVTQGDLLFAKTTSTVKGLAKGTNHYGLKVNGNTLAWEALSSGTGTVTSVNNADTLLSIANKTTTPTITMNGALVSWASKARPSGTVVGTSDVQTLTAKTISGPIITTAISTNTSLQGPLLINGVNLSINTMNQGGILFTKTANTLVALDNGAASNRKVLRVNGNTLAWETAPLGSGTSTGTNTGDQTITLTGDVTGTGIGSFATTVASQTSANWATKISDEIGTGRLVFNGSTTLASPTLITPAIGVATGTSLVTTGKIVAGTNLNGSNLSVKNGGYFIAGINFGNGGTAESIDFSKNNNFAISLNAASLAISAGTDPTGDTRFSLAINQRAGSQAVTWTACASASGFCFPGGTVPTITVAANSIDVISCWYRIAKDRYYCVQSGDFR